MNQDRNFVVNAYNANSPQMRAPFIQHGNHAQYNVPLSQTFPYTNQVTNINQHNHLRWGELRNETRQNANFNITSLEEFPHLPGSQRRSNLSNTNAVENRFGAHNNAQTLQAISQPRVQMSSTVQNQTGSIPNLEEFPSHLVPIFQNQPNDSTFTQTMGVVQAYGPMENTNYTQYPVQLVPQVYQTSPPMNIYPNLIGFAPPNTSYNVQSQPFLQNPSVQSDQQIRSETKAQGISVDNRQVLNYQRKDTNNSSAMENNLGKHALEPSIDTRQQSIAVSPSSSVNFNRGSQSCFSQTYPQLNTNAGNSKMPLSETLDGSKTFFRSDPRLAIRGSSTFNTSSETFPNYSGGPVITYDDALNLAIQLSQVQNLIKEDLVEEEALYLNQNNDLKQNGFSTDPKVYGLHDAIDSASNPAESQSKVKPELNIGTCLDSLNFASDCSAKHKAKPAPLNTQEPLWPEDIQSSAALLYRKIRAEALGEKSGKNGFIVKGAAGDGGETK